MTFDSKQAPLLHYDDGEEHSVTISKIDLLQRSLSGSSTFDQVRYRPILQDDKSCGCLCTKRTCFFSFGALYDDQKHRVQSISGPFTQRNGREKCRDSFVDSGGHFNGDRAGSLRRIQKDPSPNGFEDRARMSFVGGHKYSVISEDGKTASPLLAQSWNTILRGVSGLDPNNSLLNLDGADSVDHSFVSTPNKPALRESSKVMRETTVKEMSMDSENRSTHQSRTGPVISTRKNSASPSPQTAYQGHQVVRRQGMPSYGSSLRNRHISESMTTDKESQTFLLLSDEDFQSLREDTEDIYNAPEMRDESYRYGQ